MLEVLNEGDEVHDLAVENGPQTKTLESDESQRLDLGAIAGDLPELYCTLPGHKTAGMTLDIRIQDSAYTGLAIDDRV